MIDSPIGIPDNERWLHEPEVKAKLDRALARAERTPFRETDLDELEERLRGGGQGVAPFLGVFHAATLHPKIDERAAAGPDNLKRSGARVNRAGWKPAVPAEESAGTAAILAARSA